MTRADEEATMGSDCGNKVIDGLAAIGRMMSVWDRLEYKFSRIRDHAAEVWLARRSGAMRRKLMCDDRFAVLRKPEGPETDHEWAMLEVAALEAIGYQQQR
jgi:hypothetical protein